ncbi:hypothetical protein BDZ88DRAFT_432234 [Geranomyces variabilis]|nr:hypothetical protein BDZ88DRAFT_432234 [Geranomyces variabilis]
MSVMEFPLIIKIAGFLPSRDVLHLRATNKFLNLVVRGDKRISRRIIAHKIIAKHSTTRLLDDAGPLRRSNETYLSFVTIVSTVTQHVALVLLVGSSREISYKKQVTVRADVPHRIKIFAQDGLPLFAARWNDCWLRTIAATEVSVYGTFTHSPMEEDVRNYGRHRLYGYRFVQSRLVHTAVIVGMLVTAPCWTDPSGWFCHRESPCACQNCVHGQPTKCRICACTCSPLPHLMRIEP